MGGKLFEPATQRSKRLEVLVLLVDDVSAQGHRIDVDPDCGLHDAIPPDGGGSVFRGDIGRNPRGASPKMEVRRAEDAAHLVVYVEGLKLAASGQVVRLARQAKVRTADSGASVPQTPMMYGDWQGGHSRVCQGPEPVRRLFHCDADSCNFAPIVISLPSTAKSPT